MSELEALVAGLTGGHPQPVDVVAKIAQRLRIDWPADYVAFLTKSGGGTGWVGEHYIEVWPPDEIVSTNADLNLAEFAPNLVGLGSDGGGELFAFDRSYGPPHIVMTPMIGLDLPADFGTTFLGLLRRLHAGDVPGR
jgi:hypothetical protein